MSGYEYGPDKKEFVRIKLDLSPGKGREHEHALLNNMADFVRLSKYTVKITKPYYKYNEQSMITLENINDKTKNEALKLLKAGHMLAGMPAYKIQEIVKSMHVYFGENKVSSFKQKLV